MKTNTRGEIREFYELLERLDEKLREIACRIAACRADQEDLLQEMRIYLWERRKELKDKTDSYILRGCYFRAKHYLNRGKSIDSKKRGNVVIVSLENVKDLGGSDQVYLSFDGFSMLEEARNILIGEEIRERIRGQLNSKLRETFDLLTQGYSPSEIARKLNLSYEAVRLRVRRIRHLARVYLDS